MATCTHPKVAHESGDSGNIISCMAWFTHHRQYFAEGAAVGCLSPFGTLFRFIISYYFANKAAFKSSQYWSTIQIFVEQPSILPNIAGCFVMGVCVANQAHIRKYSKLWHLALTSGFCGSLTSYSAWADTAFGAKLQKGYIIAIIVSYCVTFSILWGFFMLGFAFSRSCWAIESFFWQMTYLMPQIQGTLHTPPQSLDMTVQASAADIEAIDAPATNMTTAAGKPDIDGTQNAASILSKTKYSLLGNNSSSKHTPGNQAEAVAMERGEHSCSTTAPPTSPPQQSSSSSAAAAVGKNNEENSVNKSISSKITIPSIGDVDPSRTTINRDISMDEGGRSGMEIFSRSEMSNNSHSDIPVVDFSTHTGSSSPTGVNNSSSNATSNDISSSSHAPCSDGHNQQVGKFISSSDSVSVSSSAPSSVSCALYNEPSRWMLVFSIYLVVIWIVILTDIFTAATDDRSKLLNDSVVRDCVRSLAISPFGAILNWLLKQIPILHRTSYKSLFLPTLLANSLGVLVYTLLQVHGAVRSASASGASTWISWHVPLQAGFAGSLSTVSTFVAQLKLLYTGDFDGDCSRTGTANTGTSTDQGTAAADNAGSNISNASRRLELAPLYALRYVSVTALLTFAVSQIIVESG